MSSLTDSTGLSLYVLPAARIAATRQYPHFFVDRRVVEKEEQILAIADTPLTEFIECAVASRCRLLDGIVSDFVERENSCNVVWLACGLETAFDRVTGRIGKRRANYFQVDRPEVIALRESIFPRRQQETFITCDPFGYDWVPEVNAALPTLVVMSGTVPYESGEEFSERLKRIRESFPVCEVAFDVIGASGRHFCNRFLNRSGSAMSVSSAEEYGEAFAAANGMKILSSRPLFTDARKMLGRKLKSSTRLQMSLADRKQYFMVIHGTFPGETS